MALLTCFGIPLEEKTSDLTGTKYLAGRVGNLSVRLSPSGVGGWSGFFQLDLPDDFYSSDEPWASHITIPNAHVYEATPELVVRKLELLGRLLLPHFERKWTSAWDYLSAL